MKADALRTQDPDYEMILGSLMGAVVVFGPGGEAQYVNQAAESLTGRSRAATLGRSAGEIFEDSPWISRLLSRRRQSGETSMRDEGELSSPRGPISVTAVATLLHDRDGNVGGSVVVIHDNEQRRKIQTDEVTRNRLANLKDLVASVAHELNNPLAGIRGAAQVLERKIEDDEKLTDYAAMIVRQVDRLSELIGSLALLDTAPPKLSPLNIHRVLTDVIVLEQSVAEARGITLGHEFDPSLPEVLGDADQLQQLFLNLLKNAIAVCDDGSGRVGVRTRMENSFYVDRGDSRTHYIAVEITDNGPGLDEEAKANMFVPFYSRSEGGKGLGLTISQHIASAHDGHIRAESAKNGTGTCFRVLLPACDKTRADA